MDDEIINKVMNEMGWKTDSALPMANNENRAILDEIQDLFQVKNELLENEVQTSERLEKLQYHTKNAEATLNHNLKLLEAHQSQVRNEDHLYKVAQRSHSKLKEDIRNVDRDWNNYKKFLNYTEKEMAKREKNIDKLTCRIKWAKTVLAEWQQAMQEGNRGYQLIEMYYKDDQLKVNEKKQMLEKCRKEIQKARNHLINLYNEQKTLECNLECSANLYRTTHAERRQMVETWKVAVQQMTQRENDIRQSEMTLIDLKKESNEMKRELEETDKKLNDMIENNRNVEVNIEELNNQMAQIKEQVQIFADMAILKTNEVETLQKELQMLAQRVEEQRITNRRNEALYTERLGQIKSLNAVVEKLAEKLKQKQNKNLSASQRLEQLEEIVNEEENMKKEINKEINRINDLTFRAQRQSVQFKDEGVVLKIACDGLKSTIMSVKRNIKNIRNELKRQIEIKYEMGLKILKLERKLIDFQGGPKDAEKEKAKHAHSQHLEERYSILSKTLQATLLLNKKLNFDIRKLTLLYDADNHELEKMNNKIKEVESYCHGETKRGQDILQHNQECMVDLSMLKMRIRELESEVNKCDTSTFNLKKHRMNLNRVIKDRMIEIKSQIDLLNLKKKHLNEELSTLRADIGERDKRVEAVRARFELTSKLLGTNDDGTLVTATQLRVEMVQEKQTLLDEGDELNKRVLKAEEEIQALENTLTVINSINDAYRTKVNEPHDIEEYKREYQGMHNKYCVALDTLRELRLKCDKLQNDVNMCTKAKAALEDELNKKLEIKNEKENNLQKIRKELSEQQMKLERAERELKAAIKAAKQHSSLTPEELDLFERDVNLKELETRNMNVLNRLGEIVQNDYEVGPKIAQDLTSRGLKLPHALPKIRSSISCPTSTSVFTGQPLYDSISLSSSTTDADRQTSYRSSMSDESKLTLSVVSLEFPDRK